MQLTGNLLIGGNSHYRTNGSCQTVEAATGNFLPTHFGGATLEDVQEATKLS